jgi:hypothetical protein
MTHRFMSAYSSLLVLLDGEGSGTSRAAKCAASRSINEEGRYPRRQSPIRGNLRLQPWLSHEYRYPQGKASKCTYRHHSIGHGAATLKNNHHSGRRILYRMGYLAKTDTTRDMGRPVGASPASATVCKFDKNAFNGRAVTFAGLVAARQVVLPGESGVWRVEGTRHTPTVKV